MKRRVSTALCLLIAGTVLAGCVIDRGPYGRPYYPHWKPYPNYYHYR